MSRKRAILLLIVAAVLWSTSGLFIKIIEWTPLSILSGRSIVSFVVFLIYLRRFRMKWSRPRITGALGYVGVQLFFVISTKMTAAANAIFLQYTAPLYLFLLGHWVLGERPDRVDWISAPVIFIGLLLFLGDGLRFSGIEGNLFGALSGLSMAAMMVCMRREKSEEPGLLILMGCLIGILIGLPSLLRETFTLQSLGIILFLGIFQMGLSYVFFSIAIKYLDALESSLILFIEPVVNPVWVFLVIGEVPGTLALAGGLLVIGTAAVRAVASARAVPSE